MNEESYTTEASPYKLWSCYGNNWSKTQEINQVTIEICRQVEYKAKQFLLIIVGKHIDGEIT